MPNEKIEPFALKNELMYQERYVRDMVKQTARTPSINAIYEQWLQFIIAITRICEKRNRF